MADPAPEASLEAAAAAAPASMGAGHPAWRQDVLRRLRARNAAQAEPFQDLISLHAKVFERTSALQQQNTQLIFNYEKLKQQQMLGDGAESSALAAAGPIASASTSADVAELQAKVYSLQSELTELHRRKGENAQQVIDLSAQVKANERDLDARAAKLVSLEQQVQALRHQVDRLKDNVQELEATNQLLKDEYAALQLALTSAERQLVQRQKENDRLVAQVMELKEMDVARMNEENEMFRRQRQEQVKKELEEAANENKVVVDRDRSGQSVGTSKFDHLICSHARLPTRAYLKFDAHDSDVNAVKYSPHDGNLVATAGADRKIKLWDVSKGTYESRGVLVGSNGAVMSLDFDAGGSLLLASSYDFASRVWSLEDQRLRHTLTGHSAKIFAAKFMNDQTRVCTGSHDRTLKVWDLRSKACIKTYFPGSSCNDLVCLDNLIVSGHFDKKLRFYDHRVGAQPTNEIVLEGKITSVDLSRDGKTLLACSRDDTVSLIDVRSMACRMGVLRADAFHVGCDWTRAVFSPDSEYVSVGSGDGSLIIWNAKTAQLAKTLKEHDSVVIAVAWQPAGNSLVTCDKTKQVIVWADI